MKSFYLLILFTMLIVISCFRAYYDYLDENTLYKFNTGDTLIYSSISINDTFLVTRVDTGYSVSDYKSHYQFLSARVLELSSNCKGEDFNYCMGMHIYRYGSDHTSIEFRQFNLYLASTNSKIITYYLGNVKIMNTYKIECENCDIENAIIKDIKTLYYTHKYGIIAYELFTGELFELDERYIE